MCGVGSDIRCLLLLRGEGAVACVTMSLDMPGSLSR